MALLPGNPAIGHMPNPTIGLCPVSADQTGQPSPAGAPCNAGALQPHPLIHSVTISDAAAAPTVTVNGVGFGTPANLGGSTAASTCSGASSSGDDYGSNLYLFDVTAAWSAGQGPPSACDYYGLIISTYSDTQIVFTLGSDYPTYGNLKIGDHIRVHVLGAALSRTVILAPTVTGFSPASGPVGTLVTIKGSNLTWGAKVTFNGVMGTITRDTVGMIKAKVPIGSTTGRIRVTTVGGSAESARSFTVT